MDIDPVADPSAVTTGQKVAKARVAFEMIGTGQVDPKAAVRRILEAAGIPDVEELMPEPDPAAMQAQQQMAQAEAVMAEIATMRARLELDKLAADIRKANAEAALKMAQAETEDDLRPVEAAIAKLQQLEAMLNVGRDDAGSMGGMAPGPADQAGLGGGAPMGAIEPFGSFPAGDAGGGGIAPGGPGLGAGVP
jgi:chaperonin GroES